MPFHGVTAVADYLPHARVRGFFAGMGGRWGTGIAFGLNIEVDVRNARLQELVKGW